MDVYYVIPLPFSPFPYAAQNKTTMSGQEVNALMKQPIRSEICAYTTSKSHSPITLEDWISLLGNSTKIIDTSLDSVNDSTQLQYTTNSSITNVTFLMATIPGSHLNLHAYDEIGRHVGYFSVTDSDQVQIINATYTGNISNPEVITIPDASSKNYTIKVDATQFTSSSPTPVEVYAIETPARLAVLGISPVEIYPFISPGETKNLTIQLAEVGKQVDIEDVTIILHNFTDIYGNVMPNVTISVLPNDFNNISAGTETYFTITLNASENVKLPTVPETRYSGNFTIDTSNAGEINATLHVLILDTDLPNAELMLAAPNVTGVHFSGMDLSAINETYKPEGVILQSAYMINSTGTGKFALQFTNIPNASSIIVYKINATNHWIALDTITTATNITFTISVGDPLVVFGTKAAAIFDTEPSENPYPSIMGTHKGEIKPSANINVSRLYTYPCPGTGGHTEYAKIWNNSGLDRIATWSGYKNDWHNITFDESFTLFAEKTYYYEIRTGSYPQIIHTPEHTTLEGSFINCTSFVDANGKKYYDWIPAFKLFL